MERRLRQPSLLHRVASPFHLKLIGAAYRTYGRRRASPVTTQDHFLSATACITQVICFWRFRTSSRRTSIRVSLALHRGAVTGASPRPIMPSPRVSLPGPFVTCPSPVLPVVMRWQLTSVEWCGVRAESSVQARTRTGRLQRVYPPFIASSFLLVVNLVPSRCGSRAPIGATNATLTSANIQ